MADDDSLSDGFGDDLVADERQLAIVGITAAATDAEDWTDELFADDDDAGVAALKRIAGAQQAQPGPGAGDAGRDTAGKPAPPPSRARADSSESEDWAAEFDAEEAITGMSALGIAAASAARLGGGAGGGGGGSTPPIATRERAESNALPPVPAAACVGASPRPDAPSVPSSKPAPPPPKPARSPTLDDEDWDTELGVADNNGTAAFQAMIQSFRRVVTAEPGGAKAAAADGTKGGTTLPANHNFVRALFTSDTQVRAPPAARHGVTARANARRCRTAR